MIIFSPFVGAEANVANRALSFSFIVLITIICVHNYQLHCFPLYFHYLELKTAPSHVSCLSLSLFTVHGIQAPNRTAI